MNLLSYDSVLALRARCRSPVVRYGRPSPDGIDLTLEASRRTTLPRTLALEKVTCVAPSAS